MELQCPRPFHARAVSDLTGIVDDIVLVEDHVLIEAMRLAHSELGLVLEPAGAAGLAGLMTYRQQFSGRLVGTIHGRKQTAAQMQQWLNL